MTGREIMHTINLSNSVAKATKKELTLMVQLNKFFNYSKVSEREYNVRYVHARPEEIFEDIISSQYIPTEKGS